MASKITLKDFTTGAPVTISSLTKDQRKRIGRKVLNGTLKTAPKGTRIDSDGTLYFQDGSTARRTNHGRGKKSQYDFTDSNGKLLEMFDPISMKWKKHDALDEPMGKKQWNRFDGNYDKKEPVAKAEKVVPTKTNLWKQAGKDIHVPDDVGSRIRPDDVPYDPLSLDGIRDFVVDGLGSLGYNKKTYPFISHDRRYMEKELYKGGIQARKYDALQTLREKNNTQPIKVSEPVKSKEDTSPSALDRVKSFAGSLASEPFGKIAHGMALKKQIAKEGIGNTVEDVAIGTMARLAQPFSSTSSQWWKNKQNLALGEASNIGKNIADEAMLGVTGGVVGKGIGTAYKGLNRSARMYDNKMKRLANKRKEIALNNKDFIKEIKGGFDADRFASRINSEPVPKLSALGERLKDNADMVRQNTYDNMTRVPPSKSIVRSILGVPEVKRRVTRGDVDYGEKLGVLDRIKKTYRDNTIGVGERMPTNSLGSTLAHNIKRKLGNRGMLQSNNDELAQLFEKTGDLNKARKIQRNNWNQIPNNMMSTGALLGVASGL